LRGREGAVSFRRVAQQASRREGPGDHSRADCAADARELRRFQTPGDEVFELRVAFGPGFRIYYGLDGKRIVVLLRGGDKRSQKADIKAAKAYWEQYKRLTR